MLLEEHLVLNRYILHLLGARDFDELKDMLRPQEEGPTADGQSHFLGALLGLKGRKISQDVLTLCDRRVMEYEARLRERREGFRAFRYFQYLALLFTEIYLKRLTDDPEAFRKELNKWRQQLSNKNPALQGFPPFTLEDLRRLAFFMATGSGKTLLMHVNILQVLHYLRHGNHPEALLPEAARGPREFANIILITPNEGLTAQHIAELSASGLDAVEFIKYPNARGRASVPLVKVIEIHKLAEQASKNGVSLVIGSIGQNNLVIVDEGHKGTGSAAQTWKARQKYLSEQGFLLEYSATFAQAIGAAGKKAKQALLQEYGKAILFDYSYAHFYSDGYGKDFRVLNLRKGDVTRAHELLVGGLLTFYHQLRLYQTNQAAYRDYNLEKPLWVLLGTSVSKKKSDNTKGAQRERTDVAEVVEFLRRFVEEPVWAVSVMERILSGHSGYQDEKTGQDLFAPHITHLLGKGAQSLYDEILQQVFHGRGGLEVWQIKNAEGEFGLRLSQANEDAPYFGVINIGDELGFKKHLSAYLGLEVKEDAFRPSQFGQLDGLQSPIYLLIGAKKFIEGWSSWRVSSMGLLNVGKGEGSQIIQLFGRGVRLKGKDMSLKRSSALCSDTYQEGCPPPEGIKFLETLAIFGWNADYIQAFRKMLEAEEIPQEVILRVKKKTPWPHGKLPLPEPRRGFNPLAETWRLDASGPSVEVDRTPKITAASSEPDGQGGGALAGQVTVDFSQPEYLAVLDMQTLYRDLLGYKRLRGYGNLFISPAVLPDILRQRASLRVLQTDLTPETLQNAATELLKTYLDRFVRMQARSAIAHDVDIGYLGKGDTRIQTEYRLRVRGDAGLLEQIRSIIKGKDLLYQTDTRPPLPRFHWDRSLFTPLLRYGHHPKVSITPPPLNKNESKLVEDLMLFWERHHTEKPYNQYEIYLLRNLPLSGIGLFHRVGFYPDFILWRVNSTNGWTRVVFLEPHGLHHEGLYGNADKFAALETIRTLSQQPDFQQAKIELDGYLLTTTPVNDIPDANGRAKPILESQYPLLWMERDYIRRVVG